MLALFGLSDPAVPHQISFMPSNSALPVVGGELASVFATSHTTYERWISISNNHVACLPGRWQYVIYITLFEMPCATPAIQVFSFHKAHLLFPRVPCFKGYPSSFALCQGLFLLEDSLVQRFQGPGSFAQRLSFFKGTLFTTGALPWPKHVETCWNLSSFGHGHTMQMNVQSSQRINLKINFWIDIEITLQKSIKRNQFKNQRGILILFNLSFSRL